MLKCIFLLEALGYKSDGQELRTGALQPEVRHTIMTHRCRGAQNKQASQIKEPQSWIPWLEGSNNCCRAKNVPNGGDHSTLSLHPGDLGERVQSILGHRRPPTSPCLEIWRYRGSPHPAVGSRCNGGRCTLQSPGAGPRVAHLES